MLTFTFQLLFKFQHLLTGFWGFGVLGFWGAWMTLKKAEMAKTLKNGLSMIKTNPLNHNWSHFAILSGLTLHQFQKKLLLGDCTQKFVNKSEDESHGHFAIMDLN